LDMEIDVFIESENLFKIEVNELDLFVIYKDEFFGYGQNAEQVVVPKQGSTETTLNVGSYVNDASTSAKLANAYSTDCTLGNRKMTVDLLFHFIDVKVAFIPVPELEILIEDVEMNCPS